MPRPDQGRRGRGGTDRVSAPALNLADSNDGITVDRDPYNGRRSSQVQRLATALERRSQDDRRATPNPLELALVVSGRGALQERHPVADRQPDRGVRSGGLPTSPGGEPGGDRHDEFRSDGNRAGTDRLGGTVTAAVGIRAGRRGGGFRRSAAVALARPLVQRARAAVPAPARGRPNDTMDSDQAVASAVQSLVHASTAGGERGVGSGGEKGPGAAGSGGARGPGSRSSPAGPGGYGDVGASRYDQYAAQLLRRVDWSHAFPSWAILEGRGGQATIGLTVQADGTVTAVHVVRSSGLPEFDRNLVLAVKSAPPSGPPPGGPFRTNFSFDATNPAVGRDGP